MFTDDDLQILNRLRIERLKLTQPQLVSPILYLHFDRLEVHCWSKAEAGNLLSSIDQFSDRVYQVIGCHELSIWFSGILEGIFTLPACSIKNTDLELTTIGLTKIQVTGMTANTLERAELTTKPATEQTEPKPIATVKMSRGKALPGQSLKTIALDVGRSIEEIKKWLTANGQAIIPYANDDIVSGEAARMTYMHYRGLIEAKMQERGLSLDGEYMPKNEPISSNGMNGISPELEPIETAAEPAKPARAPRGRAAATKKTAKATGKTTASKPRATTRATAKTTAKTPAKRGRKPGSRNKPKTAD